MAKQIFTFRAFASKKVYRDIEISGNCSLYKLAEAITNSFNFNFDHCFGFFDNINNMYDSKEQYELFADIDEDYDGESKGVKKTKISNVFTVDKQMLFYFDYGDDWEFLIECTDIKEAIEGGKYPNIVASKGKAPEQYPDCDDYEDNA